MKKIHSCEWHERRKHEAEGRLAVFFYTAGNSGVYRLNRDKLCGSEADVDKVIFLDWMQIRDRLKAIKSENKQN